MKFYKTKTFWFILAAIILIVVFVFGSKGNTSTEYSTDKVKKDTVVNLVTESGNVYVQGQFDVYSPINGIVSEMYVKNGETVKKGQKLFKVKSTSTDQEKASAYANYLKTVNDHASAEKNKVNLESQLTTAKKDVADAQINVDILNNAIADGVVNPATHKSYTQNDKDSLNYALTAAQKNRDYISDKYDQASNEEKVNLESQLTTAKKAVADAQINVDILNNAIADGVVNPATHKSYTQNDKDSLNYALTAAQKNRDYISDKYDQADNEITAAKKSEESAKITYDLTNNATITADVAGTIYNLALVVGDTVSPQTSASSASAAGSTTSSSVVMTIANLGNMYAKIAINEVDISKIKLEQNAQITLDAIKDKTYTGKVFNIDTIGTDKDSIITYNVYTSIDNLDESIRPNMSANVSIETARHENVLTVPNSAIKMYKDAKAVQVFDNSNTSKSKSKQKILKYVPVQIGLKGTDKTEILSGINEGDEVITGTTSAAKSSGLFGLNGK